MKKTIRSLVCLILVVLLAAAALTLTGCTKQKPSAKTTADTTVPADTTPADPAPASADADPAPETKEPSDASPQPIDEELGEGDRSFYFAVIHANGDHAVYLIHTDADTVGKALVEYDLIAGEDSQYGLYVTTVCGETLDWDTDGMYWAFYENEEYAMTGVDSTPVEEGAIYAFAATKG